jgi:hypothetical protein
MRNGCTVMASSEGGMCKTDDPAFVFRNDQSEPVEVRFAEYLAFEIFKTQLLNAGS